MHTALKHLQTFHCKLPTVSVNDLSETFQYRKPIIFMLIVYVYVLVNVDTVGYLKVCA